MAPIKNYDEDDPVYDVKVYGNVLNPAAFKLYPKVYVNVVDMLTFGYIYINDL